MIDNVFNLLFRCRHKRLSRPVTPIDAAGVAQGDAYITCLECGGRFAYDTREMRMGKRMSTRQIAPYADWVEDRPASRWRKIAAIFALPVAAVGALFLGHRPKH
jgi:hypothetical protein